MGKINWGRVFLGGIVAGAVINAFEFVENGAVLARDWEAAMKALGRTMQPNAIPIFVVWGFLLGISSVWLYAAARPRYGAGPKTAALTGVATWFIGYALPGLSEWALHLVPHRLVAISVVVGLVEVVIGSVAGAALYKEEPIPMRAPTS
jgi:hypothetical protein